MYVCSHFRCSGAWAASAALHMSFVLVLEKLGVTVCATVSIWIRLEHPVGQDLFSLYVLMCVCTPSQRHLSSKFLSKMPVAGGGQMWDSLNLSWRTLLHWEVTWRKIPSHWNRKSIYAINVVAILMMPLFYVPRLHWWTYWIDRKLYSRKDLILHKENWVHFDNGTKFSLQRRARPRPRPGNSGSDMVVVQSYLDYEWVTGQKDSVASLRPQNEISRRIGCTGYLPPSYVQSAMFSCLFEMPLLERFKIIASPKVPYLRKGT